MRGFNDNNAYKNIG